VTVCNGPNGTVSLTNAGLNNGGNTIAGVAAGALSATSTDAVNGGQLFQTNTSMASLGGAIATGLGGNSTYNAATGTVTTSLAVGTNTYTNVDAALNAINTTAGAGWNLSANHGAVTHVAPGGTIDVSPGASGNIKVTQTGTDLTIDTNPNLTATSLTTGNTAVNDSGVTLSNGPNGTVSLTNAGLNNGGNTIAGVAAGALGATSTDAVNGGQLFQTNANMANLTTQVDNIVSGTPTKYFHANSTLTDSLAIGTDSTAIGPKAISSGASSIAMGLSAQSNGANAVAIGNGATARNDGDVALGSGSTTAAAVKTNTVTINGTTYSVAGADPTSTVSVGAAGNERTITNVAAGQINANSTDAVNGSELYATNQAIAAAAATAGNSVQYDNPGQTSVTLGGGANAPVALNNVAAGAVTATSTGAINGSQLYRTASSVANALGGGSTVTSSGAVSAPTYNIGGANYNNVGGALSALNDNLGAIGASVANLQNQVSTNYQKANAGAAAALAASGLRYDDRPGKISTAAALSTYHAQEAFAGGIGWTSQDLQWRANLAASVALTQSHPDVGVVGGLSYTWN
jgi:autotransporter adhesin